MARAAFCQLGSRRVDVRRSSSGGVISVLGTPPMTARRQPQAHSACPTGGERVGAASTSLRLRWRCADRRSAPPIASSAGGRTGIIPPLVAGGGEAKGGSGYEQLSVSLSQLPEGLLDFVHRLHAVFYWLGIRESSGVEAIHTWTGDALGRGPYQAVTALNSLRCAAALRAGFSEHDRHYGRL